jgi:acetyl-CoA C-acetyltransferase
MEDVFIFDVMRTPVAPAGGALAEVLPSRLVGALLHSLAARLNGDDALDALVLGGDGAVQTPRHALASAGLGARLGAWQLQHGGVSSMAALRLAAQGVATGDSGLAVAGGYQVGEVRRAVGALDMLVEVSHPVLPLRDAADMAAQRHGVSSDALDAWAVRSREALRASPDDAAQPVHDISGLVILARDAFDSVALPQDDGLKGLAAVAATHLDPSLPAPPSLHGPEHLAPAMDGACLLLLGSAAAGARHGLAPRARLCASAAVAQGAAQGLAAVGLAVQRVLQGAGWRASELDRLEIHDAVAVAAPLACAALDVPLDRVNRMGGALVRGDQGAAAGAACVARLVLELERSGTQRGVAAIADAAGNAIAVAIERRTSP